MNEVSRARPGRARPFDASRPRARPDVARSVPSPDDVCSPRGDATADSRAHTSAHLELACPIHAYNHLRGVCTEESVACHIAPSGVGASETRAAPRSGAQRVRRRERSGREKHGGGTTERTREREREGRVGWSAGRAATALALLRAAHAPPHPFDELVLVLSQLLGSIEVGG